MPEKTLPLGPNDRVLDPALDRELIAEIREAGENEQLALLACPH